MSNTKSAGASIDDASGWSRRCTMSATRESSVKTSTRTGPNWNADCKRSPSTTLGVSGPKGTKRLEAEVRQLAEQPKLRQRRLDVRPLHHAASCILHCGQWAF